MITGLVGRSAELEALDRAVAELASGGSVLVEIAGVGGTGRSALLLHAVTAARTAGAVVLHTAGTAGAGGRLLGDLLVQARLECEVADPASGSSGGLAQGMVEPYTVSSAVLALARTRPVLVACDDGDQLDQEARELFAALGRRAAGTSLMVVVVSDGIRPILDDAVVLTPHPLDGGEIAALAEAMRGDRFDAAFLAELAELTGGRPRLVREVLERRRDAAAEAVGDAVARSVRTLPVEAVELLRAIAVCGPAFDFGQTCSLAELGDWPPARALDVLVGAGLVTWEGKPLMPVGRVLDGMAPQARQQLFARAARLGYRCAVDEVELARIVAMAPPLGEPWVVPMLRRAACREDERGEPVAAVRYLERALREPLGVPTRSELTLEVAVTESRYAPDAGDQRLARMLLKPQSEQHVDVRLAAADQLLARGDGVLARRTFAAVPATGVERDSLTALYWLADDAQREVPELSLLDVEPLPRRPVDPERAGAAAWEAVSRGEDMELASSLARHALRSPAASLVSRIVACASLVFTGDLVEAITGLDAVVTAARDRRLPAVAGFALVVRARVNLVRGHCAEAATDLALAAEERPNWHPRHRPMVVGTEMVACLGLGLLDRARELDASVSDTAWGSGYNWTSYLYASGRVALESGNLDRAVERLEESGRRWRPGQSPNPAPVPWRPFAARAWRARGDMERATELCVEDLALAVRWGLPVSIAQAHLTCADVLGDQRHLTTAIELLRDSPYDGPLATALLDLAETVGPVAAEPLVREAARISIKAGAVVLVDRARALGWVPGT